MDVDKDCCCRCPVTSFVQKFPLLHREKVSHSCLCTLVIMKIAKPEVDFRVYVLHSNDGTNLAVELICKTPVPGLSLVKISAQSVQAHHLRRTTTTR